MTRRFAAGVTLLACFGVVQADLVWDGVAEAPAVSVAHGRYLTCPPGAYLSKNPAVGATGCLKGALLPDAAGAPIAMTLQGVLDLHFKAPAGWRAVALGPLPVYDRGVVRGRVGVAYKLVKR